MNRLDPTAVAPPRRTRLTTVALVFVALLGGCRQDMHDGARFDPYEATDFFGDRRSARDPIAGTVARGELREDAHLHLGKVDGSLVTTLPFPATLAVLERGRDRFDIYCSPCHDRTGRGQGIIVQRGFRAPPSFHAERLREVPIGHFFDVVTNGFGVMQDYAAQISVEDRWAIAAYIRALQASQRFEVADLSSTARAELEAPVSGKAHHSEETHGRSSH